MKRIILLLISIAVASGASAQDALSIIRASRDLNKAASVSTLSRMAVRGKNGDVQERVLAQYSKDDPAGMSRTVVAFQQPRSVAGTRFLTIETSGSANDQWIYLPALRKVRRIASSEGSGSFMGTDFSYDDIASADRDYNLDTHAILREETLEGKPCYVIESKPKDTSYQYSRMLSWIDKSTNHGYRLELYDQRNILVKTVEMRDFQDVQGRLSPMRTIMTTVSEGTSTTLHVEKLIYDDPIPESVFTPRFLETGRP